jgi:hypothetical protein
MKFGYSMYNGIIQLLSRKFFQNFIFWRCGTLFSGFSVIFDNFRGSKNSKKNKIKKTFLDKSCIIPRYMLCSNLIIVHAILKAWKLFLWFFWDWKCPKIWYIGYIRIFLHIAHFKDCFKGENDIFDNFDFNHLKSTYLKYNFKKKIFFRF